MHSFRTHAGIEFIAMRLNCFQIHFIRKQLTTGQGRHARIDNHKGFEVQHALNFAQRHVQHQTDTRWQGFEEPDMRCRAGQVNVTHALAPHLGLRHFNAAFFADNTAVFQSLVLAAQTFVILDGSEYLGAEQTITLRFKGAVVDGLRLFYFAI